MEEMYTMGDCIEIGRAQDEIRAGKGSIVPEEGSLAFGSAEDD